MAMEGNRGSCKMKPTKGDTMRLHEAKETDKLTHMSLAKGEYLFWINGRPVHHKPGQEDEPYQLWREDLIRDSWWVVPAEVIEVGDTVRWEDSVHEFTVLASSDGIAVLQSIVDLHHIEGMRGSKLILLADIRLIRKGPKVITFEGVTLEKLTDIGNDCRALVAPLKDGLGLFSFGMADNGKKYTLTLKKEQG